MSRVSVVAALALGVALRATAAPPPTLAPDAGAGFHLEPRPAFEDVFGDTESYRKTVDRFMLIAAGMQKGRDDFTRAVQGALAALAGEGGKTRRSCPEAEVAPRYARALKLGAEYLQSGRELTRHYEQIRELDRLGETVGLTLDYRTRVKRALAEYGQLLVDYREMKVSFHDQLADELRFAACNPEKLLARADASALKDDPWPVPGQPGAPGIVNNPDKEPNPEPRVTPADPQLATARTGIFIYIDNSACATGTHVALDGKALSDVPPATRASFETTAGPHDLCLLAEGNKSKCGDPGTVRRSYLHEGWTISLRCN